MNATDKKVDFLDREVYDKDLKLERKLTLDDVTLSVCVPAGTEIEVDTTCDSTYMESITDEIGENIRRCFHWLPISTPITLFMDNAGGHGTDVVKKAYTQRLLEKFNVIIEWQVPNSPETNLLDLGTWCTIQSVVEWIHRERRMDGNELAKTVIEAWETFDTTKLTRIANRWIKVLDLIIKGGGTNDLVEKERGLTTSLFVAKPSPFADDVEA